MNIARALNIGIISWMCNFTRKENKVNFKFQFILWIAGLRGAMAYALALESFNDYSTGKVMLVITLIYSLFSVLFIGSIFNPIITYIGVEKTEEDLQTQIQMDDTLYTTDVFSKVTNIGEKLKMKLYKFNSKYFRPLFVVDKSEAEHVADLIDSQSQSENRRKSDNILYQRGLNNLNLSPKKMVRAHSLDNDNNSEVKSV